MCDFEESAESRLERRIEVETARLVAAGRARRIIEAERKGGEASLYTGRLERKIRETEEAMLESTRQRQELLQEVQKLKARAEKVEKELAEARGKVGEIQRYARLCAGSVHVDGVRLADTIVGLAEGALERLGGGKP